MVTFQVKVLQDNFEPEIRRFTTVDESLSYEGLKEKIENVFTEIQGKEFEVFWLDDEKDEVKITSDEELDEAVGHANGQVIKMVVKITHEDHEEMCNGCENKGVMFKCSVCPDVLLCGECTINGVHNEHQVVRIEMVDESPRASSRAFEGMMGPRGGIMGPRPRGMARGRGGMSNPRRGMMGPRGGLMGPRGGMMGPRGGMARGCGGMSNPRGRMIGPRGGLVGPRCGAMGPRGCMPVFPRGCMHQRGGHCHRVNSRMDHPRDIPMHPGREQMMTSCGGMFGPRNRMMGPRDGMMPPRDGMMPPRDGMMPPRDGMMPPRDGMMPPRDGMMPPRDGMMPPRDGMMSPRDGMMSPRDDMVCDMGGMMGPMGGETCEGMPERGMPGDHADDSPRFMVPCA